MKVLLCEDVHKVGSAGEVKEVSQGFARNFLLPRKLAMIANDGNLKKWESEKRVREIKLEQSLESAKAQANAIEALTLDIEAKAGREGHLFGSVTTQILADALLKKGFSIDKKHILLDAPIKTTGEHTVPMKLHPQVTANLKVSIAGGAEAEAAAAQQKPS